MKLKYRFVVESINGGTIAAAVGRDNERFHGMIKLNASGEVIFKMLQEDCTEADIVSRFAEHFGITEEMARPSVTAFLDELRKSGLLEEA